MRNTRRLLSLVLVLVVGLAALAVPSSVAVADDGGTTPSGGLKFDVPGILSLMLAPGGASAGGAVTLGPVQLDLANFNAIATVEGLTFGQGGFGWDAITLTQKAPSAGQGLTVSDAQATVQGPSTGYSADASAHLEVSPSEALQAQATVGLTYNGLSRQTAVTLSDMGLTVDTPTVGVQVAGVSNAGALTAETAQLSFPATGATATLNGFNMTSRGADWDTLVVQQDQVKLGQVGTLSNVQLIVRGPSGGYAADAVMTVELNAGEALHAQGQIELMYDPTTGRFAANLSDGSAELTTDALSVRLSGISYSGNTLTIDSIAFIAPPFNVQGQMTGIAIGSGVGVTFQEAWVRYIPEQGTAGSFGGIQFAVQNMEGQYLLTTQMLVTPVASQ